MNAVAVQAACSLTLQDISPTVSTFCVSSTVEAPVRAAAAAASHPACPPPMTTTSHRFTCSGMVHMPFQAAQPTCGLQSKAGVPAKRARNAASAIVLVSPTQGTPDESELGEDNHSRECGAQGGTAAVPCISNLPLQRTRANWLQGHSHVRRSTVLLPHDPSRLPASYFIPPHLPYQPGQSIAHV